MKKIVWWGEQSEAELKYLKRKHQFVFIQSRFGTWQDTKIVYLGYEWHRG